MGSARPIDLGEFIRNEGTTILRRWEARAREVSVAHDRSRSTLLDHLPAMLEAIADGNGAPAKEAAEQCAWRHAVGRIEEGYGLAEVVAEYIELRSCIFERLEELDLYIDAKQSRGLHRVFDHALREAAARFMSTHQKMLRALDRIAGNHTGARTVDQVLGDIVDAMRASAGADVDSIAILLVGDDGRLRIRATIGLEQEKQAGTSYGPGEGFAGVIAHSRTAKALRDAANDPTVVSDTIRRRGTRALYGVPLVDDGRVIGVAHMGSSNAYEFSEEDLMLFRALAERATTVILRAQFVESLERTSRFREQFIAVLGHELRNPLGGIMGTVQLFETADPLRFDRVPHAFARIGRLATRMNQLISDILDFTRARLGGGFPLKCSRMSLSELVREVADEHTPALESRRLDLEVADEPIEGEWDRARLAQVLSNLLTNAIQHSPEGSRVRVSVTRELARALVEVWNEGPPIAPGTKLFEPFERGATSGGLGLGLYISHEIARAHGGALSVRSDANGTSFTMCLPLPGGAS